LVLEFAVSGRCGKSFWEAVVGEASEKSVADEDLRLDVKEIRKVSSGSNPATLSAAFILRFAAWLGMDYLRVDYELKQAGVSILWRANHFEPVFPKERKYSGSFCSHMDRLMSMLGKKCLDKKFIEGHFTLQRRLALLHGALAPVDYAPRPEGTSGKDLAATGAIVSDKKVATTQEARSELEEKVRKELLAAAAKKDVADQAASDKLAKFTGILPSGKVQYNCRYKGGSALNKFCESHPILRDAKETYGHPFLRTVSNWYWLQALAAGLKSSCTVMLDVASKYHHLVSFLKETKTSKRVIAARPSLFRADQAYNRRHAGVVSAAVEIDRSDRHVFGADYAPLENVFYVLNDCLYYRDILEGLRNTRGPIEGRANMIVYPHQAGTYSYLDGEGTFTVSPDGRVVSRPRDNPTVYEHPIQCWERSQTFSLLRVDGSYLCFVPEAEVDVGGGAYFVSYNMFETDKPSDPLSDPVIRGTYALKFLDFTVARSFQGLANGVGVFRKVDYEYDSREEMFVPPKDLYDLLSPSVRWRDFESKYDFSGAIFMANQRFPGLHSRETVQKTVMCILLDDAKGRRMFEGFRAHPENFLSDTVDFTRDLEYRGYEVLALIRLALGGCWITDSLASAVLSSFGLKAAQSPWWQLDLIVLAMGFLLLAAAPLLDLYGSYHRWVASKPLGRWALAKVGIFSWLRGGAIQEQHYDVASAKRLYWPLGNANVLVKKKISSLLCTCRKTYRAVFKRLENTVTHFGACKMNLESAIYMRQFNHLQIPNAELAADFLTYVKMRTDAFIRALPQLMQDARLDYSFDSFLRDTAPQKRKKYAVAWREVQEGRWGDSISFFSKTNEVHVNNASARPRNIGCFPETFTVVGAYYGRLMIKVAKRFFPGFTSGMNLDDLGRHIEKARVIGNMAEAFWYMADGSGFDSSQWQVYIRAVDHTLGPAMYEAMLPFSEVSPFYADRIKASLFAEEYNSSTARGDKFVLRGSVPSGHPLRTTLFNTIRTTLYHEFALLKQGRIGIVFAAGDDALAFCDGPVDPEQFARVLSPQTAGIVGLGVTMKDFKTGFLEEMDFLSKHLCTDGFRVEVFRRSDKVAASGLYTASLSKRLTRPVYAAMQALQLADLPVRLRAAAERFRSLALNAEIPAKLRRMMEFDWSVRLYLAPICYRLDSIFYFLKPPQESLFRSGQLFSAEEVGSSSASSA